jgi:hypothetical protein
VKLVRLDDGDLFDEGAAVRRRGQSEEDRGAVQGRGAASVEGVLGAADPAEGGSAELAAFGGRRGRFPASEAGFDLGSLAAVAKVGRGEEAGFGGVPSARAARRR